jgi:hypothetical protein
MTLRALDWGTVRVNLRVKSGVSPMVAADWHRETESMQLGQTMMRPGHPGPHRHARGYACR